MTLTSDLLASTSQILGFEACVTSCVYEAYVVYVVLGTESMTSCMLGKHRINLATSVLQCAAASVTLESPSCLDFLLDTLNSYTDNRP